MKKRTRRIMNKWSRRIVLLGVAIFLGGLVGSMIVGIIQLLPDPIVVWHTHPDFRWLVIPPLGMLLIIIGLAMDEALS